MSEFSKAKKCKNRCGGMVYFDAHSSIGHPIADKWVPLELKDGLKTNSKHECSKKTKSNGFLAYTNAAATAVDKTSILDMDNLFVIKIIAAALNEYMAIKEGK